MAGVLGEHSVKTCTIKVTRGDFAPLMQSMIDNLEKAKVRVQVQATNWWWLVAGWVLISLPTILPLPPSNPPLSL